MSNTAVVSPYRESCAGAEAAAALCRAISAMAQALGATAQERAVIARYREAAQRERLTGAKVSLRLADGGDLLSAARGLGFTVPGAGLHGLAAGRPVELSGGRDGNLLLQQAGDDLTIFSVGGRLPIENLVARTVERRLERRLGSIGSVAPTRRILPNGEVELTVSGVKASAGGSGKVIAHIAADGRIGADISCIAGSACEQVLAEVADAVAGVVEDRNLKADYYADPSDPGELARVQAGA